MAEARVRKIGLWLLGDAAGIRGAWKALNVFFGFPMGVDGAGVKKGQRDWQVAPTLPPSARLGHPFLLLEHGGCLLPLWPISRCCRRKGSLGRKGLPEGCWRLRLCILFFAFSHFAQDQSLHHHPFCNAHSASSLPGQKSGRRPAPTRA